MPAAPSFDVAAAHKFFSGDGFNRAWDLLEKRDRTPQDDEQMLLLSHASLWHWTQRADFTPRRRSIGAWQLARVHAVLGLSEGAQRYAEACLQSSANEAPFYRAYAHEALARAARLSGRADAVAEHLAKARALATEVTDAEERAALEKDLASIG